MNVKEKSLEKYIAGITGIDRDAVSAARKGSTVL